MIEGSILDRIICVMFVGYKGVGKIIFCKWFLGENIISIWSIEGIDVYIEKFIVDFEIKKWIIDVEGRFKNSFVFLIFEILYYYY